MSYIETHLACGRPIRIPLWQDGADHDSSDAPSRPEGRTPPWLVQLDNLVFSDISGYENYCCLYGWYGGPARVHQNAMTGLAGISTPLQHSELILIIANGGYTPKIENCLGSRRLLQTVTLVRTGGKLVTPEKSRPAMPARLHEITYKNCYLDQMIHHWDHLALTLRVGERSHTAHMYDSGGRKQGHMTSSISYAAGALGAHASDLHREWTSPAEDGVTIRPVSLKT